MSIDGEFVTAPTAYEAMPGLIRAAQAVADEYGIRVSIKGSYSTRCRMWHYIATPQPDQRLTQWTPAAWRRADERKGQA